MSEQLKFTKIPQKFQTPKPIPNSIRDESGGTGRTEKELQLEFTQKLEKLNETEKKIIAILAEILDSNSVKNVSAKTIKDILNHNKNSPEIEEEKITELFEKLCLEKQDGNFKLDTSKITAIKETIEYDQSEINGIIARYLFSLRKPRK